MLYFSLQMLTGKRYNHGDVGSSDGCNLEKCISRREREFFSL